ncbi:unnamed protein product [Rotaria sordida]|uniref:Uncharacterized protein n=1 Tax=Rotaria sordida TaxID=392033 RepID=A0A814TZA8_9BILA|nr:unnamed protein product [Rotaria sordida]CAF1168286.1 unnamed protein product [Rotaria sordida]
MLEKNIVTLDGISEDQTRTVTLCFGSNVKVIRTLGLLRMHDLLSRDTLRQFSLIVSPEDCVFTFGDPDEQELSEEDMKKLVEEFPQPIQCRIWLKVHIHQYDIQRDIVIKIKEDTITVDQILHMHEIPNEDYKYLASSDRNAVIADDQKFVDLNETKFILLKENETCCVSIGDLNKAQEDGYSKRYAKFATIADVLKDSNVDADCLLCLNDIAPSKDIKLALLPSPIQFQIIKDDLLALVTVTNPEQENCSIQFKCSKSITTGRVFEISCQLLNTNTSYYQLNDESSEIDYELTLEDLESSSSNFHFNLVSIFDMTCYIRYKSEIFKLPCSKSTAFKDLVEEMFRKLHISEEDIDQFQVEQILNDNETSAIDMDLTIDDILAADSGNPDTKQNRS